MKMDMDYWDSMDDDLQYGDLCGQRVFLIDRGIEILEVDMTEFLNNRIKRQRYAYTQLDRKG